MNGNKDNFNTERNYQEKNINQMSLQKIQSVLMDDTEENQLPSLPEIPLRSKSGEIDPE